MDDVTSSVTTQVVQTLMGFVKKHLGILFSSTKNVKKMKKEMEELKLLEQDVQHDFDEAYIKKDVVSHLVSPWLDDVKKMNEDVESIPAGGIGCFNIVKRYKAGRDSLEYLEKIQTLKKGRSDIVFTNKQISLAELASYSTGPSTSTPDGTQIKFESRDLIYKAALKSLHPDNDSQKKIALCGTGGVGKTTMMKKLKEDAAKLNLFDRVVEVVLGENHKVTDLQGDIAIYSTGEDLKEDKINARAERLRIMFEEMSKQGKKVLVIMDDLWSKIELYDFGLSPLPNGFKMMFTSRDERFCTHVGVQGNSIFKIGLLNQDEAESLFFDNVGHSEGDDPTFRKIGEEIVKKCRGLPIAIVTVAKSLEDNIEDAWKEALRRLEKGDLEDLESITHRIFEMSYENLKKDKDKAIFLLCALFPDDFNIRTEDLLRFGWGLDFFKDVKTLASARSGMKVCVNDLKRANLLTESDRVGCVKMHDLVRAFVLNKVLKVKQASITNYENISKQDAKESYDRVLLKCTGMTQFSIDFSYPNLSMLMLMDGSELLKFPEDIYERMKKLEVISYDKMHIPMFPISFEHSTKLRTLCLRSCSFLNDDVSFLGSLTNLETLSFVDCNLTWLPSTIGKLKKLKLLDLTGCVQLRIDDGVFQNLESLEELYMRATTRIRFTYGNCDELEILSHKLLALELEFFKNKVEPKNMSFERLERFRLSIGCQLLGLEDGERDLFRNTIQLVRDYNEIMECKISDLFDKTEELHLQVNGMSHLEDVFTFSKLIVLHVSECADLTCLFTVNVVRSLKKLERLTIAKCPVMRTLVAENNRVEAIRFPNLMFMSLNDLPKMESLWDNVIDLPELMNLVLDGLPNFTSIYTNTPSANKMQSLLDRKVVIPRLENLEIRRMENLKSIWSCETNNQNNVSMLRKIDVEGCDNLVNLFPNNPLQLLNHLEELKIKDCGSIEVLFNIHFESYCETGECKLRSITVRKLGKLKELWRMIGVNKSDIHIDFHSVESIGIINCHIFEYVFSPVTTNFSLGALTHYAMCKLVEKDDARKISEFDEFIPNATYPPYFLRKCHQLQHLVLAGDITAGEVLFNMDTQRPLQFSFQNLTLIHLGYCNNIKYLFSPLIAKYLSNLKMIYITSCDGIEEVVSSRDDDKEENTRSTSSRQNSTLFPHMGTLWLHNLPCLNSIDGGDHTRSGTNKKSSKGGQLISGCWSLCQYPTYIKIVDCNALSSLIPWYAVGQMKRLRHLEIWDCSLMTEVFTFSTLESLTQLKEIRVTKCKAIQVIVKEETGTSSQVVIKFPCLKTLILDDLPDLKGFFLGVNEFEFPSLDDVFINDCPQLMKFTPGNQSKTPKLKFIQTNFGKYSVESCGLNFHGVISKYQTTLPNCSSDPTTISKEMLWSFHNLIEIYIERNDKVGEAIIPPHALQQLQKLQKITISSCKEVKKVFEVELEGGNNSGFIESQTTTVVKIPNLTQVELKSAYNLKYLWKSSQWMVLEFLNLTTLTIERCNKLEYVFTCSMVFSLVQLQDLSIKRCENIEEIVKEEEECDANKVNEIITLPCLRSLKLVYLSSLKGFCIGNGAFSFPALDTLEINECPEITVFTKGQLSTPELRVIDTTHGKWHVKPDLNTFIKTKQEEEHFIRPSWESTDSEESEQDSEESEQVSEGSEQDSELRQDLEGSEQDLDGLEQDSV